jgi:hypothetical protein
MKPRDLVRNTLEFSSRERIPRQAWILPWAEKQHPDTVRQLQNRFPADITWAPALYTDPPKTTGDRYSTGEYIDEWGCKFANIQEGIIGSVVEPLIKTWGNLEDFQPPRETLSVDAEAVNAFCHETDKFVLSCFPGIRPFERLQFIRTMEQALIDLITDPPGLAILLESIHGHYCKEVETWAKTEVDGIMLMDDWGTQQGLLVSPDIFHRIYKPMYREYADIAHQFGKYVFIHSDGNIVDIIADLIDIGIDALNSQLFCMDVENLGRQFRGQLTFWGEIDRQHLLPFGTREEIERAVHRIYDNLYANGGIIAQCEFGLGANPDNVMTVFETWDAISPDLNKRNQVKEP